MYIRVLVELNKTCRQLINCFIQLNPTHCYIKINNARKEILRRFRVTIVAVDKQEVLHILSVCVALFFQHARCMRHIILSSAASLAPPYFSALSHKRHDFRKKSD